MIEPFQITVTDDDLADLTARVAASRFTRASGQTRWGTGTDPTYLRELAQYWATEFDWRSVEQTLNALPQFVVDIDGARMHFLHFRAENAGAGGIPILLAHGWPSSFIEMLALADRLAHPSKFGRPEATSFDVVVPSLPGFLYSELPSSPLTRQTIAASMHTLMTTELGYQRYGIFGGDIGGASGAWAAWEYPDAVVGIVQIHPSFPASFDAAPLTAEEQSFLDAEALFDEDDEGYSSIMMTRPDTIAASLIDSPIGLAAWIVDKYRDWSDCNGDISARFDRDTILTIVSLYWFTGSIGSSFRSYADYPANGPRGTITVPAAFTLSCEPGMIGFPRSLAERSFTDIRFWLTPGRGGHFLAHEEPELAATSVRDFFDSIS